MLCTSPAAESMPSSVRQTKAVCELRQPLGIAVVGGLLVSQLLTLYITPVIYIYLDRFDRIIKRRLEPQLEEVRDMPPAVAAE